MTEKVSYELDFSDITLLESGDASFSSLKKIMESDFPYNSNWMVESGLTFTTIINKMVFEASFILHFYGNGDVYIMDYRSSSNDLYLNTDIRGLAEWIEESGWKRLLPSNDLVEENVEFWKYFWESHLIDSDYLEKHFGPRDINDA